MFMRIKFKMKYIVQKKGDSSRIRCAKVMKHPTSDTNNKKHLTMMPIQEKKEIKKLHDLLIYP